MISRHRNLIAFKFEMAHLRGALRAASNSEAESTEIKLAIKSKAYAAEAPGAPQRPFLCLNSKGMSSNMTHELPISQPLVASGACPFSSSQGNPSVGAILAKMLTINAWPEQTSRPNTQNASRISAFC